MDLNAITKYMLVVLYNHRDGLSRKELLHIINTPELLDKEIRLAKYKVKRKRER